MKVSLNYSGFDKKYFVTAQSVAVGAEREALREKVRAVNGLIAERVCVHHDRIEGLEASILNAKRSVQTGRSGRLGFFLAEKRLSELERYVQELEGARHAERRAFEEEILGLARQLKLAGKQAERLDGPG